MPRPQTPGDVFQPASGICRRPCCSRRQCWLSSASDPCFSKFRSRIGRVANLVATGIMLLRDWPFRTGAQPESESLTAVSGCGAQQGAANVNEVASPRRVPAVARGRAIRVAAGVATSSDVGLRLADIDGRRDTTYQLSRAPIANLCVRLSATSSVLQPTPVQYGNI